MDKPTLFIGSAKESIEIVEALESGLLDDAEVKRWDVGSFKAGEFSLQSLLNQVSSSNFAAFVLGQDDKTMSRGKSQPAPRDNVIFEGGLFASRLGLKRTFFIVDSRGTKRPSDWDGLGYLTYRSERKEPRQKVLEAVQEIRKRIREEWNQGAGDGPAALINGNWWQLVTNEDQGAVVSCMEIDSKDANAIRIKGESWSNNGESLATYRSRATNYVATDQVLYYSWEGEHPRQRGLPKYFGAGEIRFDLRRKEALCAQGYFSSTDNTVKQCVYFPASEADVAILRRADSRKIQSLMLKLLSRRKEMRVSSAVTLRSK